MSQDLVAFYNSKYENEMVKFTPIPIKAFPKNRYEACVKFLVENFKEGSILELGAGSGKICDTLIDKKINFSRYTISDFSEVRLNKLKAKYSNHSKVDTKIIDAENVQSDEQYDAVVMLALIEHLIDPIKSLNSVAKVIKKGGFLFIDTANVAKYTRRIKLVFGRFPSTGAKNEGLNLQTGQAVNLFDDGHLHYFTNRSLKELLLRAGFTEVYEIGYFSEKASFLNPVFDLLARIFPKFFADTTLVAYKAKD